MSNMLQTTNRILMKIWNVLLNEITKLLAFKVLKKSLKLTILEILKVGSHRTSVFNFQTKAEVEL